MWIRSFFSSSFTHFEEQLFDNLSEGQNKVYLSRFIWVSCSIGVCVTSVCNINNIRLRRAGSAVRRSAKGRPTSAREHVALERRTEEVGAQRSRCGTRPRDIQVVSTSVSNKTPESRDFAQSWTVFFGAAASTRTSYSSSKRLTASSSFPTSTRSDSASKRCTRSALTSPTARSVSIYNPLRCRDVSLASCRWPTTFRNWRALTQTCGVCPSALSTASGESHKLACVMLQT